MPVALEIDDSLNVMPFSIARFDHIEFFLSLVQFSLLYQFFDGSQRAAAFGNGYSPLKIFHTVGVSPVQFAESAARLSAFLAFAEAQFFILAPERAVRVFDLFLSRVVFKSEY